MNGYHKQNGRARPIQLRLSLAVAITKALIDSDNSNDIGKNIDNKKIINIGHRKIRIQDIIYKRVWIIHEARRLDPYGHQRVPRHNRCRGIEAQ